MNPVARYFRSRLHRRIFLGFGLSIVVTAILVSGAFHAFGLGGTDSFVAGARTFVAGRFADAWGDPPRRDALARSLAEDMGFDVTVRDAGDRVLVQVGAVCGGRHGSLVPVALGGERVGAVSLCGERHAVRAAVRGGVTVAVLVVVLWAASGGIARRMSRPITELARIAEEMGSGNLARRPPPRGLGRRGHDEVGLLSRVLDDLAARVDRQLADQRALLAAVSHEVRTPLARLRLLVEFARGAYGDSVTFDKMDEEIVDIDALVSDLLASSRIDFSVTAKTPLVAQDVAREALRRAGEGDARLDAPDEPLPFFGDPTLVARALSNLVGNAQRHGGGVAALRITKAGGQICFEVDDDGEGFAPGEEARVFEPFYRGTPPGDGDAHARPGVGLGLALVRRIAEAHRGRVYAKNRTTRGATVGITFAA